VDIAEIGRDTRLRIEAMTERPRRIRIPATIVVWYTDRETSAGNHGPDVVRAKVHATYPSAPKNAKKMIPRLRGRISPSSLNPSTSREVLRNPWI
jgi:hypothetical protein